MDAWGVGDLEHVGEGHRPRTRCWSVIVDTVPVPARDDIMDVLTLLRVHEDGSVCDAAVIAEHSGMDIATADNVRGHLWKVDRIEGRVMRTEGGDPGLVGVWRVLDGRERRWGPWGRSTC
jgi:hypothetical protein